MNKNHQVIKGLTAIYPLYLVVLAWLPLLTGYLVDADVVDSRYFVISLVWIPFFTIPAILTRKKAFIQIANFLFFVAGFIEIAHWIILKGPISLTSILVISNTNLQESVEFFDLKATYELLLLIPYVAFYIFVVWHTTRHFNATSNKYVIGAVVLFVTLFIGENAINGRLVRKGVPQLVKLGFSFYEKMNLYEQAAKETKPKDVDVKTTCREAKQVFVLIFGESCNRNHMSLYGYKRNTTPYLEKRKDITVFDDVVSAYSNTLHSVLSILSVSNLENKIELTTGYDLIDVFHSAGFKTFWISNQSPIGVWDNLVTVLANKADVTRFVNISSNSSFEAIMTSSYDSKLFKPFEKALADSTGKKFIVLHLIGSHASYMKRYPGEFDVFKGNDSKQEIIAQYDNSILYTDFIVDSLLRILNKSVKQNDEVASAIYLSDHGENVYDELNKAGHDYSGYLPKANVEIPFFVWESPKYRSQYPEKVSKIDKNTHKPFVSDDLFHSILDLNCITGSFYDSTRSLFNSAFNADRKRILEDNMDYDEK